MLPINFTLVRHGLSEPNRVQKYMKENNFEALKSLLDPLFLTRHDSTGRLAKRGVEQAQITGEWLRENLAPFDRFYVSPHVRTQETAAHLRLGGEWIKDDRFRERDWGEVSTPTPSFEYPMTEVSRALKALNEWYWKPAGGETLATGVRLRVESVMTTLTEYPNIDNVIAVTHGDFIRTAMFHIEKLTPEEFNRRDIDPAYKVMNTAVVRYTRQNPFNPEEIRKEYHWRSVICPWDESQSWSNGEWVEFHTKKYSDDELLAFAENFGKYFLDER